MKSPKFPESMVPPLGLSFMTAPRFRFALVPTFLSSQKAGPTTFATGYNDGFLALRLWAHPAHTRTEARLNPHISTHAEVGPRAAIKRESAVVKLDTFPLAQKFV